MRTVDEVIADARVTRTFSSGTEYHAWSLGWCMDCVHDNGNDCGLVTVAFLGYRPKEWQERYGQGDYICSEYQDKLEIIPE